MKKTYVYLAFMLMLAMSGQLFAQNNAQGRGQGRGLCYGQGSCVNSIPDLSDDQKTKIEALRVSHMKELTDYRNELGELEAKLRTISTKENSQKEADQVIEQIGTVKTSLQKACFKHRQDVRSLLTDAQKVHFDSHPPRYGCKSKRRCCNGQGQNGNGRRGNCPRGNW